MLKNQELSKSLPDAIVNIEEKTRSNLFTWRGQFSPQLIESLLQSYAKPGSRVFDPFLGSGTVLYESALLGLSASGCEINPAATAFARIYELCNEERKNKERAVAYVEDFVSRYATDLPRFSAYSFANFQSQLIAFHSACKDAVARSILTALIVGLDFESKKVDLKRVLSVWGVLRSNIERLPYTDKTLDCYAADARNVPVEDSAFDLVVTSPPYINVFNYHQNYRKSVELLGVDVLTVARSEIGANRKFRQNRFITVVQYCMDMAQVFTELKRVCKLDAKILFIVGRESNVKKTAFFNAALLKEVAQISGLDLIGEQHRVFGNKFGQDIYEEILRLRIKNKFHSVDIVERARDVGIRALETSIKRASKEVKDEIIDAIEKSKSIGPSPILGN